MSIDSEAEYYFDDQFTVPFDANLKNRDIYSTKKSPENRQIGNQSNEKSQLCQSLSESCICSEMGSSFQEFPDVLDELLGQNSIEKQMFSPSQSISENESKMSMNRSNYSNTMSQILKSHLSRDYRIVYDDKQKPKMTTVTTGTNDESSGNVEASTITWGQLKTGKTSSLLKQKRTLVTSSYSCHNIKQQTEPKIMSWNVIKDESSSTNLLSKKDTNSDNKNNDDDNLGKRSRSFFKGLGLEISRNSVESRAKSEPRNSLKSITNLFEIYSRSRAMKESSIIIGSKKNFGAQFPPVHNFSDGKSRLRSNSFENKHQNYPGIGELNMPKSTRLNDYQMLSRTLPDLSFLTKSSESLSAQIKNKKSTFIHQSNSKDSGLDSSGNEKQRMSLIGRNNSRFKEPGITNDLISFDEDEQTNQIAPYLSVPNFNTMDLLTGSPRVKKNLNLDVSSSENIDRSVSETNVDGNNPIPDNEIKLNKPKKSVSFNEKKLSLPLSPIKKYNSTFQLHQASNLVPQAIPRNLGLYGSESVMISEFTLGSHLRNNENELSSDDIKYKMLVKSLIKSIQKMVDSHKFDDAGYAEKLSAIIELFHSICTDGILPYPKPIASLKSRHRLWNIIEISCGNSAQFSEALRVAKKIPVANEKARFKSFIKSLISSKHLSRWFKILVNNDSTLRSNYSKESFLRQCRNKLKGLYADLETNLQLLDKAQFSTKCLEELSHTVNLRPVQSVKSLKKNNSTGQDLDRLAMLNNHHKKKDINNNNTSGSSSSNTSDKFQSTSIPIIRPRTSGGVLNKLNTTTNSNRQYLYKPTSNTNIRRL